MYQIGINTNTMQMNNNLLDEDFQEETISDISDIVNYTLTLSPSMDSPDSVILSPPPSHAYVSEEAYQPLLVSPGPSPETQDITPYLEILEQPTEKFRFRYKSEMAGTHGSLTGRKKRTYPTVQLHNYDKPAVIRCSLYQCNKKETIQPRQPHAHRLVKKRGSDEIDDPHEVDVNINSGFVAKFPNMGIIHTAKRNILPELESKIKKLKSDEIARNEGLIRSLSRREEQEVRGIMGEANKSIDLNIVCLQFEAFEVKNKIYYPLCDPVYSSPISNLKSALTGELKIVRMDLVAGPVEGQQEIFILVEKVKKRNVRIRFYELDNEDIEIWNAEAKFSDLDVHHQYAIVFKTPAYRDLDIKNDVKVFIELQRPSDGARSEPREYIYTPSNRIPSRKRPRLTSDDYSTSSNFPSNEQPPIVISNLSNLPAAQECDYQRPLGQDSTDPNELSLEIQKCLNSLTPEEITEYLTTLDTDAPQEIYQKSVTIMKAQSAFIPFSYTSHPLRNLDSEETKIITDFREEFLAFVKTNPTKKRMSMMLKSLFEKSADVSGNMETVLHLLISENNQNLLPLLLKVLHKYQETDLVNMPNIRGQTALHLAVQCHNILAIEHLLCTKADIAVQDLEGNTAFHIIAMENAPHAILKLLCMVKDEHDHINMVNYDGLTALHLAVKSNNIEATKILCENKADVNVEDKKTGDTILHVAVVDQRLEIVKFLLENSNVNITKENYAQYSPFKLANLLLRKNTPITRQIYKLLEIYMAKFKENQPLSPDDVKEKYSKVKIFTEECLDEVSEILDKSGIWYNLAELLGYDHLVRSNIFASSKNLLQFAMKEKKSIFKIRNFLENLDEFDAVECIDIMVLGKQK
ncbi:hypothetical protein ILUMI_25719 [Ignelater luminosus]|uniref:RHD domain-containing protein n=1 Tax=Ignelater luminosus TaxID=2038154 RepID=A0A8K0FZD3_IGNLU|nr:hypothetical protein ILUMI_25719 [Ignelater luminosus]